MKDFFISYNKADRAWAEWIASQLDKEGYDFFLQAWDIRPGSNFVLEMQRAAAEADRIICVFSPDYLAALYTQPEWAVAFAKDPTGEKGTLLPVRVRECKLEGLLPQIVSIDLVNLDEPTAKRALLDGVKRGRLKPDSPPQHPGSTSKSMSAPARFPGALPQIWNIPHQRNPNFVGRDKLLDRIRETLTSEKAAALTAIHGLGGVGKTQLAAEYAYRHKADYEVVWWIKSEKPETLASDYSMLAALLDLPQKEEREQTMIVAAVRDWLNHNRGWLLVFDNARHADDVREYLPQNRAGHVLITSRDPIWGSVAKPLEVEELPREDSIKFLLERTGQEDKTAADKLAAQLGDLPLALEQAGAYIETTGKPLAEYLALFQRSKAELLGRNRPVNYPDTVATTWEISFREVEKESAAAAGLMNLCAFLAPDDIPLSMLRDDAEDLPVELSAPVADELKLDDAIAALRRYSLMERSGDSLSVHRLVQLVARERLSEDEQKKWAESAVRVVNEAFPSESFDVRTWPSCARLLQHALTAAEFGAGLKVAPEATGRLLNQAGLYFQGRALYAEAREAYERALRIDEAAFGPDHPEVATDVNNLGGVLIDLGELAEARECFERALRIGEATLGPDHPKVAIRVNNLGLVLNALGDMAEARECFERALRIDEAAFGPDNPDVASIVNNLGLVLKDLGELAEARQCFERALRIGEATFGPGHPHVATYVNNLGLVLNALGDLTGARPHFERALRIRESTFGLEHPDVANSVWWLGTLMEAMGDLDGARQYYERALQIYLKFLGEAHPDTVKLRRFLTAVERKKR